MIVDKLNTLLVTTSNDSNEYHISSYLLTHWQSIIDKKVSEILKEINVSKSTLLRYCKILGYKNFTEVQYQLFYEMSKIGHYNSNVQLDREILNLEFLFKNKKRIIILGDDSSIGALLIYKSLFFNIGVELCFKLIGTRMHGTLEEYNIDRDDIVIYISLYMTNLELSINYFNSYTNIIDNLITKNIPFIYIGQLAQIHENENYFIEIKNNENISDGIFQLCEIFEKIYKILDKK